MCTKREVPCGWDPGPTYKKGPGSSGVLDALWCNLSPILGAFYPTNLFIYLFLLSIYYLFFIQHNLSGSKSNSSGRAGDFGKFASKREISRPKQESWSLCMWFSLPGSDLAVLFFRRSFEDVNDDSVTLVVSKAEDVWLRQCLLDP